MSATTVDLGYRPDPERVLDVLAFVLCPPSVFAPGGDDEELRAVRELLLRAKAEAARRFLDAVAARRKS